MYAIPIVGWLIGLILHTALAIPFWFIWNVLGIGKKYFFFLPDVYTNVGFWECVGIFICVDIISDIVFPHNFSIKGS